MIEVRKKGGERIEALLRRFNRLVQESGLLKEVKRARFKLKEPTRRERRESARRKAERRRLRRPFKLKKRIYETKRSN